MKYTPENITQLAPNQIFVYGANKVGRHGAGAARLAYLKFGAKYGKVGLVGQSYGLCTKDEYIETMPLKEIRQEVTLFIETAKIFPHLEFLLSKVGCGLAGYTVSDIAPMFRSALDIKNIILPKEFHDFLSNSLDNHSEIV